MTFYSFPNGSVPHSKNRHVPYHPKLKWAIGATFFFATACSIWAAIVALLQHRTYFPQYHASLWRIIAAYYVASILSGLTLGFLYPLFDRRLGAVLLGFLLGFLCYATVGVAMFGFQRLPLAIALIPAVLVGGGLGLVEFDEEHKYDPPAA